MIRRALLIAVPDAQRASRLPGTLVDVRMLSAYLQSVSGGAWEASEIIVLRNPSAQTVRETLDFVRGTDYSFVSFSGHGFEASIPEMPAYTETRMVCGDGGNVGQRQLTPYSNRSTILLDCCRNFIDSRVDGIGDLKLGRANRPVITRQEARAMFDEAVSKAQGGPVYVHGCEFNGTAADAPSFTASLVTVAERWAPEGAGVRNLAQCFEAAKELHSIVQPGRTPQLNIARGYAGYTVPFAIGNLRAPRYG